MKHLTTYENIQSETYENVMYKNDDIVKTSKMRLMNHHNIYNIVKILDVDAFGGDSKNAAYISYKVETVSFDSNSIIKFWVGQKNIIKLATPEEIQKYNETIIETTAKNYNL